EQTDAAPADEGFKNPILPSAAAERYADLGWSVHWLRHHEAPSPTNPGNAPLTYTGEYVKTETRPTWITSKPGSWLEGQRKCHRALNHLDRDQLDREATLARARVRAARTLEGKDGEKYREVEPGLVVDERGRLWAKATWI